MANEINEVVSITITAQDARVSQASFGNMLVLPEAVHTKFTERYKLYNDLTELAVDFPATSKTYKAAAAAIAQLPGVQAIYVGRADALDADVTATLNAIKEVFNDFYTLISAANDKTTILAVAAWAESSGLRIYGCSNEDADVLTSVTTDVLSLLKGYSYNRTFYMAHHQSGKDLTSLAIVVASGIATVTKAAHGLRVGDPVTISGATPAELNGNKIVLSVPLTSTFTYASTSPDGSASGTIIAAARYTFPEAAWASYLLSAFLPGAATWFGKQLTGIAKNPPTTLSAAQKAIVLGKYGNTYVEMASLGFTQNGTMVSGRFIDIQIAMDWIKSDMQTRIFTVFANVAKIPYTNKGAAMIEAQIRATLQEGIDRGILQPILNDPTNRPFIIEVPDVATVSVANRQNRLLPNIKWTAQAAGAVHKVTIQGVIVI